MSRKVSRRYRRRSPTSKSESTFYKRGSQETFFGSSSHENFFQSSIHFLPPQGLMHKCDHCDQDNKKLLRNEDEERKLQKQEAAADNTTIDATPSGYINSLNSGGQVLPKQEQAFFSDRMGYDFSNVKIHTGSEAATSATAVNAKAYTVGNHIVFNEGEYNPSTTKGKKLLAHELTHVVQQNDSQVSRIQRTVKFNVTDWDASAAKSPVPVNAADPHFIVIPPQDQVLISGLVETTGSRGDRCNKYELGTTQTAYAAWTVIFFKGRTAADGSVVVYHQSSMPMRDPGVNGSIWYDNKRVRSPAACGDSTGIFHNDGPWHTISKAVQNTAVAGSPLNYLTAYARGLFLVTYLTAREKGGSYLQKPLKFRYWSSLQNFAFSPNYASPLASWGHAGGITVLIGSASDGLTSAAPYYTTAGMAFNDHFNDPGNWITIAKP